MEQGIWSGLAHVSPETDSTFLENALGAYVNVVAIAADEADFLNRVAEALRELDLKIIEMEDILLHDEDDSHELANSEVLALSEEVAPDCELVFGAFHSYDTDTDVN